MKLARLADIAEFVNGVAFKQKDWTDSGRKIIRIQNLNDPNKPYNKTLREVPDKNIAYEGDLLVSWSGSLGVFEWNNHEAACINQHIFKVLHKKNKIDKAYLKYALKMSLHKMEQQVHGATMKHITKTKFQSIKIPLPPIEEQKRIASILDKADALRAQRRQAIAKLDELLQSVFLDMFGDPVTNPKGWDIIRGEKVFKDLRYGTSSKCTSTQSVGQLPVIRIPNVLGGKINWEDLKFLRLEEKDAIKMILQENDLLFVRTNGNPEYIGRCAVFSGTRKAYFASYLIRSRLDESSPLTPQFLKDLMSFPTYRHKIVKEAKTTAGNYNISTVGLRNLQFIKPDITTQNDYCLLTMEIQKNYQKNIEDLKKLDNLFASLQQRAFKGEL